METHAIEAIRSAVEREHLAFMDLVQRIGALRRVDEDARAEQLGLSRARVLASDGGDYPEPSPHTVVLRLLAPVGEATYSVKGDALFAPGSTFEERAYDDGTHGDERSGDHVFSATVSVDVPQDVSWIAYQFFRDDVPEFMPLPPLASSLGARVLHVTGDQIGPVHVLGESRFMAERTHPDAEGQRVIAREIAGRLREFPSFERFLRDASPGAGSRRNATAPAEDR